MAVSDGVPVSLSAINASLPDVVQLGGIYTPPALRGRGHARAAVAASLLAARERGASRAVLFTKNPSAVRTYEALGFRRIGDYARAPALDAIAGHAAGIARRGRAFRLGPPGRVV